MASEDSRLESVVGTRVRVRLLRQIGEGGMGVVYLAESVAGRLPYAVKVLAPKLSGHDTALRRFFREAMAASSVRHPGVISVVDTGRLPDGAGYYIMELLEGEDLATTLHREGRLSWPRVRHIALQLCDAMALVHAHGIIHRDLKPANCFRTTRGRDPDFIKILDFGVAKIVDQDASVLTGAEALLGTLPYMAPELLQTNGARDGDGRVDVWALGVTLHELLIGRRPFRADNPFALLSLIGSAPVPSLHSSGLPPDWPAELDEILARALAKDPGQRFTNMNAFASALQGLAEVDPVAAFTVDASVDADAPTHDEADRGPTIAATIPHAAEATLRLIRRRARSILDDPRTESGQLPLPGGAHLVVERGDLGLQSVDAILGTIPFEGLVIGSTARRLCELAGPATTEALRTARAGWNSAIALVPGGRLRATHLLLAAEPASFPGLSAAAGRIDSIISAAVNTARQLQLRTLALPLLFAGGLGMPRTRSLVSVAEALVDGLDAADLHGLSEVRIIIADAGESLARSGGELHVHLPDVWAAADTRTQRFALGWYPRMAELGAALTACLPPAPEAWTLRDADSERSWPDDVFTTAAARTPAELGIVADMHLVVEPLALPVDPPLDPELLARCAIIDWTLATRGQYREIPLLCSSFSDTRAFFDALWSAFPPNLRPPPFTYGRTWALRLHGFVDFIAIDRGAPTSLAAIGVVPGRHFEVILLGS